MASLHRESKWPKSGFRQQTLLLDELDWGTKMLGTPLHISTLEFMGPKFIPQLASIKFYIFVFLSPIFMHLSSQYRLFCIHYNRTNNFGPNLFFKYGYIALQNKF